MSVLNAEHVPTLALPMLIPATLDLHVPTPDSVGFIPV